MPTTPRQHRREADTRTRILAEATKLFSSQGFGPTTIRQIAAAVKLNSQLIYYYFGDKTGLYRTVLDDAAERVGVLLADALQDVGRPRDRLERFIIAWVRVTLAHAPTIRMLHAVALEGNDALTDDVRTRATQQASLVRRLIREGIDAGEFHRDVDPRLAATSLVGMTQYLALGGPVLMDAMALRMGPRMISRIARETASLFLRGIAADASATARRGTRRHGAVRGLHRAP